MMYHDESTTDLASLDSSSSSSPVYCRGDSEYVPYTVQSPPTSSDGDESNSVRSNPTAPLYTVLSPSSDSDKASFPGTISPTRLSSTFSSSSGSRVSRNWNRNWNKRREKGWNQCYMIMEGDEQEEHEHKHEGGSQMWLWFVWVFLAFCFVCLIFWGSARPYTPRVAIESMALNNFYFGEGLDYTGVPTRLITVNSTLRMNMRNPSSYFGIHIHPIPVVLSYLDVTVATAQLEKCYLPRKKQRKFSLNIEGNKIPIYGAGPSLAAAMAQGGIPLRLNFDIGSHINVLGRVVKTKHLNHISCSANISTSSNRFVKFKDNSCKYS